MARKKKTAEPIAETNNNTVINDLLENITDSVLTMEKKVAHINHIANMTKYILDRQYNSKLMHFDAYTWLHGNIRLIEDQHITDELADISNTLEAIKEQVANQNTRKAAEPVSLGLGEEIIFDDNDLPF